METLISNNKKIAKNTLLLYIRMFIVMTVSLYMTRVVIHVLGADDYGLYNAVGGVVAMLAFLNGTLSTGTSRFITFELGQGDEDKLKQTFSTAFYTHLLLAIIVAVFMETAGLWFLYNKLVVDSGRITAAMVTFQASIVTTVLSITQVPYTSVIMAHENMSIYAYVSIFEASAKLLLVFLLQLSSYDKLITYAILVMIVQAIITFYYRYYCAKHYKETKLLWLFDKEQFRNMMGFNGWNLIANLSETLRVQGVLILYNLFFLPVVVAAQAIGNQIANQMMLFYSNFRNAINPKLMKLYAIGEYKKSEKFALKTNVYVFDLTLLISLPLIILMKPLLELWLVEVPEYTIVFAQFIVAQRLLASIDGSFYISMVAAGKLRTNSIASLFLGIFQFVILYLIFKFGGDVMWSQYLYIVAILISMLFVKPIILIREINYSPKDVYSCIFSCLKVTALSLVLIIPSHFVLGTSFINKVILLFWIVIAVVVSSYLNLEKSDRNRLKAFIYRFFNKRNINKASWLKLF